MSTITTTIDIGASAETVWRVLTHFSSYPTWNPFIRELQGKPEAGQRIRMRVRFSSTRVRWHSSRIVKVLPATEMRWRRKLLLPGLFDSERAFIIVPNGVKGARFIQREQFAGLLAPLAVLFITKRTHDGFKRMNAALKKTAEAMR